MDRASFCSYVGVRSWGSTAWLRLFRRVARAVCVYRDAVEAAEAEEAEEARGRRDHGDQGGPSGHGGQA